MAEPKLMQDIGDLQDKSIVSQATAPAGTVEGRFWLDVSDNTYQGTVFEDYPVYKASVEQKFKDMEVMHWMGGI